MAFRLVYPVCLALMVLPLFSGGLLPFIDLPQQAAQAHLGMSLGDGSLGELARAISVNPYASQRLPIAFVQLLAAFISLDLAFRVVLALAFVGTSLMSYFLVRQSGGEPWWAIAGLPVSYGFCTYWGFFNFLAAVPLGLALIYIAGEFARKPRSQGLALLAGCALLLFASHVLVLLSCGLIAGVILLLRASDKKMWPALGVLLGVVPLVGAWWWAAQDGAPLQSYPVTNKYNYGWFRVPAFFGFHVQGIGAGDEDVGWGIAIYASVFLAGARPCFELRRWVPFGLAVLLYAAMPATFVQTAFLYGRFTILAFPLFLVGLDYSKPSWPEWTLWAGRAGIVVIALVQLVFKKIELQEFAEEARGLERAIAHIPARQRIIYAPFASAGRVVRGPAYLHAGQWYGIEKDGLVDFSFAEFYPQRFRYQQGQGSGLPPFFEWRAGRTDPQELSGSHEWILSHGPVPKAWTERVGEPVFYEYPWAVMRLPTRVPPSDSHPQNLHSREH